MSAASMKAAALFTLAAFLPTFALAQGGPFPREGSARAPAASGFFLEKELGPSVGHDEHGRVTSLTDRASGATVQIERDAGGRVTTTHGGGHRTEYHYASAAALAPDAMIRDGQPFRIVHTGTHSATMQPLHKGTVTADSVDILAAINGAGDFMDSCSAQASCSCPTNDPQANFNWSWSEFWDWATRGGIAGGTIGFWGTYLSGVTAMDALANAAAVFGIIGGTAGAVFYGSYQFGSWIYGRYGEAFWIRYAP